MKGVLAIIVTYEPDEYVIGRVINLSNQVEKLIVYDNSESSDIIRSNICNHSALQNVKFITNGKNNGISTALNFAVEYLLESDLKYLATFDQDTDIPSNYISSMIDVEGLPDFGVIGPVFEDQNSHKLASYPVIKHGLVYRNMFNVGEGYRDVMAVITSGAVYPKDTFLAVGAFIDDYFIDYVENEHCLRILKNGRRVVVNTNVCIKHELGKKTISSKRFKIYSTNYSPIRKYYMSRNRVDVWKKYILHFPGFVLYDATAFIYDFLRVVIFESGRKSKLRMIFKGIKHALLGKSGKLK